MNILFILLLSLTFTLSNAAFSLAQDSSITPTASSSGDNSGVTQSNSTSTSSSTTTQDQDVTNSSTNTISGDQINNTYISGSSSGADTSSIRSRGGRDPLRARDTSRDSRDGDRSRNASYDRDLLRAATPSQKEDLVDNKIEAQDDAIRADRLLQSSQQSAINAQSINNRAPDTGRLVRPVTGPAAAVQFAPPQPATPIVVVPSTTSTVAPSSVNPAAVPGVR